MTADPGVWVSSSLPRVFTTQIQCSFGTYFWEMYTMEFGWTAAEYGTVSTIYNATLFFSYLLIGLIYYVIDWATNKSNLTYNGGTIWITLVFEVAGAVIHSAARKFGRRIYKPFRLLGNLIAHGSTKGYYMSLKPSMKSNTTVSSFPNGLLGNPLKPPVQCAGCFNTPRMNAWKRFMGTRAFCVYTLVAVHGIGMCTYELGTQATPVRVQDLNETGNLITVNMMFFTFFNLIVIWLFSFVRYYVHSIARLANTFLVVSSIYLPFQIPILGLFIYLTGSRGSPASSNEVNVNGGFQNEEEIVMLISLTVFHSTVFFWIFTGGPLTFYVSTKILGGHELLKAFGVPAILVGFAGAMVIPGVLTLAKNDVSKANIPVATSSNNGTHLAGFTARRCILGICIFFQFFTFLFFYPYNYVWNVNNWFNYVILIITGVVNTLFLSYTYLTTGLYLGSKVWRMIAYGIFYAIMGLNVSTAMGIMFRSFAENRIKCIGRGRVRFSYRYCFPTVYTTITITFWIANLISFVAITAIAGNKIYSKATASAKHTALNSYKAQL